MCVTPIVDAGDAGEVGVLDAGDGGPFQAPTRCTRVADCPPSHICESDYDFDVCRPSCTAHEQCASGVCDYYIGPSGEEVLGCSTVCRPGTSEGCPTSTTCRVTRRVPSMALREGPPSLTLCAPFNEAGGEGCPCADLTGGRDCDATSACVAFAGDDRRCARICADGDTCPSGRPCQIGPDALVLSGVAYGACPDAEPRTTCP